MPTLSVEVLYFSDMRGVMAKHTAARVILGGATNPRTEAGVGYGGRYPGVVEEAWWTLRNGKPLYVAGGFGGAAALVADLLEGKDIPEKLQDRTWVSYPIFAQNALMLDADPMKEKLGVTEANGGLGEGSRGVRHAAVEGSRHCHPGRRTARRGR